MRHPLRTPRGRRNRSNPSTPTMTGTTTGRHAASPRLAGISLIAPLLALLMLAAGCSTGGVEGQSPEQAEGGLKDQVQNQAQEAKDAVNGVRREIEGQGSTQPSSSGQSSEQSSTVTVARAIDGDTLELASPVQGKTTIRLVGVDTPESVKPGEKPQPLGKEAAAFTEDALEGKQVKVFVAPDPVDPYDRLLANVQLQGASRLHAEALLSQGLAQTLFYDPNTQNEPLFTDIQEQARQRNVGIWGVPPVEKCLLTDRGNGIGAGSEGC